MRKILTQEEIEQKQKRRNIVMSIVLLLVLVGSTLGYAFISNDKNTSGTSENQNGVVSYGDKWVLARDGQQFAFSSSPESTNTTSIILLSTLAQYSAKPIYIDSEDAAIYYEIASTIGVYSERVQYACYLNCENSTYAQKTCSDNLIVVKPGTINKVYQNQSCVFIEGDMRAVDAFLYRAFGIV